MSHPNYFVLFSNQMKNGSKAVWSAETNQTIGRFDSTCGCIIISPNNTRKSSDTCEYLMKEDNVHRGILCFAFQHNHEAPCAACLNAKTSDISFLSKTETLFELREIAQKLYKLKSEFLYPEYIPDMCERAFAKE